MGKMLCGICNKNPATVHLTEIANSSVNREVHLCEACARKKGVAYKVQVSIADILGGLIDPNVGKSISEMAELRCPDCGLTYAEFRARTRLGCARDYDIFEKGLIPLIEKIHGNLQHIGKTPARYQEVCPNRRRQLEKLETRLRELVEKEQFERAAQLRDTIVKLRKEMQDRADES